MKTEKESTKIGGEKPAIQSREDFGMKYGWFIPDLHRKHISNESEG